ncbi:O-antigen ligase family protein [Arenibacter algicola]|uniref:O-antigen ligase family protein n=1 Tax=Arenibacter algicola TaxID=616991 RepID=UPI001C068E4D|nr:O-antigen ligase family protein [Arenibacter algicola]MBU2903444.1 O-antigen ligase family protein [Arenibacter algicola]
MSLIKTPYYFLLAVICLLLVILPQINIPDYVQSTVTSKFIFFAYACLLILGGLVTKIIISKSISVRISKLDIALLLFVSYITLNRYVIQPNLGFSIRYMELLGLGVLYIVLRTLSIKIFLWLLLGIVVSGTLQAIYGSLQLLGYYSSNHSGFNISGSFFNPGPYSGFLATVWPVALGMYLFRGSILAMILSLDNHRMDPKNRIVRILFEYIPIIGLMAIAIVLPATRSRSAWLAVLMGSLILLGYRYSVWKKLCSLGRTRKVTVAMSFFVILMVTLFGLYIFKKGSADGRLVIWKISKNIVKENPVFGVGFDRFKAHYMDAQAEYFVTDSNSPASMAADNTYYAFNELLQFLIENGLLGLVLATIVVFLLLKVLVRPEKNELKVIGLSILLTVLVFGMFSYPAQILPIKIIWVTTLALLVKVDVKKYNFFSKLKRRHKAKKDLVLKMVTVVTAMVIIWYVSLYIKTVGTAFGDWNKAMELYGYGVYKDSCEEFKKAWPQLKNDGDFLMNYGKALVMAGDYERAVKILERAKNHLNTTIIETALGDAYKAMGNYSKAETSYRHAANMIPHRFYPPYLLARLYYESGQIEKARAKAKEIFAKEVKIPSKAIREIKSEMERILEKPLELKHEISVK